VDRRTVQAKISSMERRNRDPASVVLLRLRLGLVSLLAAMMMRVDLKALRLPAMLRWRTTGLMVAFSC
jgi:hypothetical protein